MYHMDTAEPIRKSAKTGKSTKLFIVVMLLWYMVFKCMVKSEGRLGDSSEAIKAEMQGYSQKIRLKCRPQNF